MIVDKKYTSEACSQCLKTAIAIQSGESAKDWSDLGGIGPLCTPCLKAIKSELISTKNSPEIKICNLS